MPTLPEATAAPEPPKPTKITKRPNGKVSKLSFELRDELNTMIRDGVRYKQIIQNLGEPGQHLNTRNISRWKLGNGYKDWCRDNSRIHQMRATCRLSFQMAKEHQGAGIHQGSLQLAASQIYELLTDFDAKSLREKLDGDPQNYTRIVNTLARLSEGGLKYERYRAEVAEKKAAMQRTIDEGKEGGFTPEAIEKLEEMLNLM